MPSLSQLSQLLPGCYSKTSTSSSPWHHGELFQLRGHHRFRFLNKAGAFWSFEIMATDDEGNSIHLDEDDETIMTFKAEIIESPDVNPHEGNSSNNNNNTAGTLPTLCIISFSGSSSSIPSFHFDDDGQEYKRFSDLPSFPIATEFLTASLGSSSVSLATTALRFVTENVLRAQRAYLSSDLIEFRKVMDRVREKCPIGSITWKRDVKFVKQGPFFQSYCLVRILDFIDRKITNKNEGNNEKIEQPFNLTIIGVKETETDAPESFEEFVNGNNGDEDVKKILLDSRLFPISSSEGENEDDEDFDPTCQDEEIFLSALFETNNNNNHHVEFDASVPLPIRSMVFWYAELLFYLGEGNFSKTKVSYQIFEEESMKLFVSTQERNTLVFPQFPWQSLKPSSNESEKNNYNEADQFIIIYPRAEPHGWIEDSSLAPSSSSSPGSTASFASGFFSPKINRKNNNQNERDLADDDDDNNNASATFTCPQQQQQQYRFTTSGITLSPSGRPTAVLDDRSLFEPDKCPGLEFNHNMRSAYYCHWLLHETSHAWYEMKRRFQENVNDKDDDDDNDCFYDFYGHLNLEPESHSWFDRNLWPQDFVSESGMEEDYFFEAIEKRFLVGCHVVDDVEEAKDCNNWKLAVNRTNWPCWAKLKNRPKLLVNPKELSSVSSLFGKYRSDETIFDDDDDDDDDVNNICEENKQDYISIFGVHRNNTNNYPPKIIKWQSLVGESPIKLYLESDSSDKDTLHYSSISPSSSSCTSLNDDDFLLSKLNQDRSMHVSFHKCSSSNFSSTPANSTSWCWVAALRIGSSFSCLPAMTFCQYEKNPALVLPDETESDIEKMEEAKQKSQNRSLLLSVEQKAKHDEQRRSKKALFHHKVAVLGTKLPNRDKSTTVFNKYSENGKMDSSICVCAIMNSLLPQANSILVLKVVKEDFLKRDHKEVNAEEFCRIVHKVFQRWIENEKEQILDDLGLLSNEVDEKKKTSDDVEEIEEL